MLIQVAVWTVIIGVPIIVALLIGIWVDVNRRSRARPKERTERPPARTFDERYAGERRARGLDQEDDDGS